MRGKFVKRLAAFAAACAVAAGTVTAVPDSGRLFGIAVAAADGVAIDETNFPDEIFRQYVLDNCDTDKDKVLSEEEISGVTGINVIDSYDFKGKIQSLKGIEFFTALEHLSVDRCYDIKSLDVSSCTSLKYLSCYDTRSMENLDVSGCTSLEYLNCEYNLINMLDLSNCFSLTYLNCGCNCLASLDLSNNNLLTDFKCENSCPYFFNPDVQNTFPVNSSGAVETCGIFDMKKHPDKKIDLAKTSNWRGAVLKDGILDVEDRNVYYDYDCGNGHIATFTIDFTIIEHTLTVTPEKQATCTENGNIAYYTCDVCGKIFTDSTGTTETTLANVTVPAHHIPKVTLGMSATCTENGNNCYWQCEVCGKYFTCDENFETTPGDNVIPAFGHSFEKGVCIICGATDPDYSEEPETPDVPVTPEDPDTPDKPDVPETPENPDNPETPNIPDTPENPEAPETPDVPVTPDKPITPDIPSNPGAPSIPPAPSGSGQTPSASRPVIHAVSAANEYSAAGMSTAVAAARPGSEIRINAQSGKPVSEKNARKLAAKKDVTASFEYSGYTLSVNSDDMNPDKVGSLEFASKTKFLTKAENRKFDGAAEVRQFALGSGSWNGISKATLTVTMKGGSKNKTAKLLLRTAEGKYILVSESKVGSDRLVSFTLNSPGNYIVYTGEADIEYKTLE